MNIFTKKINERLANTIVYWTVIVFAILVRLFWLPKLRFWHDEIWVVMSLFEPSIKEMIYLDWWTQSTPVLFLVLARLSTFITGYSEIGLRLFVISLSMMSVVLGFKLTKKITRSVPTAYLCMMLLAFHPLLVTYSVEFKHYVTDILSTILILYTAEFSLTHCKNKIWQVYLNIIIGIACIFLSYTAVFIIPAVALRLCIYFAKKYDARKAYLWLFEYGFFTGLAFIINYVIVKKETSESMMNFWQRVGMPKADESIIEMITFFSQSMRGIFMYFISYPSLTKKGILLIALFVLLFYFLSLFYSKYEGKYNLLCYATIPLVFNIIASALNLYPFIPSRTLLYYAPIFFLMCSSGFITLLSHKYRYQIAVMIIPLFCFTNAEKLYASTRFIMINSPKPDRAMFREILKKDYEEGDIVYTYYDINSYQFLDFYTKDLSGIKPIKLELWFITQIRQDKKMMRNKRVWYYQSIESWKIYDNKHREMIAMQFRKNGCNLEKIHQHNLDFLYLWNC